MQECKKFDIRTSILSDEDGKVKWLIEVKQSDAGVWKDAWQKVEDSQEECFMQFANYIKRREGDIGIREEY